MASTIPKYEWTTHEVREWMADHFVTIMNRERSYAITIAQQYQGTGKQLFSNTKEDWLEVFERKVYGREMHDTMAGILRNDEELKKTGLPLQLLPLYQHRQIIEIVQGTFINQNSKRSEGSKQ
ncbi:hypothetical protein OCU04_012006 [Sclerotinia nivalis]|uniref:Uncharacterized protein n=1 Tax=Sclerotinia nivalis TaxID=352851 RepID=A0A9X0DD40_9HELO|nr:hypothetical protein OCU04_012006 [Sclerotinia nivalis]